jgi:undecaprenyl-diphosphatase
VFEYVLLGVVQGLTELLPISSSGHLVLVGYGLGVDSPGVLVEVVLHLGTLLAVVWAFRRELVRIARGVVGRDPSGRRLFLHLVVATLPVVVLAPVLDEPVHAAFEAPVLAAVMLFVTGGVLILTRFAPERTRALGAVDALIIGLAQVLALMPGISRSGMTISAGFGRGIDRQEAARFSFLMSIPAILGAGLFEAIDLPADAWTEMRLWPLAAGFAASFVAAIAAIRIIFHFLGRRRFEWFGVYCFAAATLALILMHARLR